MASQNNNTDVGPFLVTNEVVIAESEKYKTIAESLNFVSVELRRKIGILEQEVEKLEQKDKNRLETIDLLGKMLSKIENERNALELKLNLAEEKIINLDRNLKESQTNSVLQNSEIYTLQSNLEIQLEKEKTYELTITSLERNIDRIQKQSNEKQNELLLKLENDQSDYHDKVKMLEHHLEMTKTNNNINTMSYTAQINEKDQLIESLETQIESKINIISQLENKYQLLTKEKDDCLEAIKDLEEVLDRERSKYSAAIEDYQTAYRDVRSQLETSRNNSNTQVQIIDKLTLKITQLESDFASLQLSSESTTSDFHTILTQFAKKEQEANDLIIQNTSLQSQLICLQVNIDNLIQEKNIISQELLNQITKADILTNNLLTSEQSSTQRILEIEATNTQKILELAEEIKTLQNDNQNILSQLSHLTETYNSEQIKFSKEIQLYKDQIHHEQEKYCNMLTLLEERELQRTDLVKYLASLEQELTNSKKENSKLNLDVMSNQEKIYLLENELSSLQDLCRTQQASLGTHSQTITRLEIARQRQDACVTDGEKRIVELMEKLRLLESGGKSTSPGAKGTKLEECLETMDEMKKTMKEKDEDYEELSNVHQRAKKKIEELEKSLMNKTIEAKELQAMNREFYRKIGQSPTHSPSSTTSPLGHSPHLSPSSVSSSSLQQQSSPSPSTPMNSSRSTIEDGYTTPSWSPVSPTTS